MTPERIATYRAAMQGTGVVHKEMCCEILDALEAANATIQRLQSSPAPVVGGVPELTEQEIDAAIDRILKASGSALRHYTMALNLERMRGEMREILASRLSSIKPGEEVVNSEEYAALRDFAERIVPIRDNLSGISWVGNLKDVFAAYDNWYAIRIAQGTPTEKITRRSGMRS